MIRWLANSLKRKLSLLLLSAVLIPLLVTGVVSYRIASAVTEEKEKQSGMNTLRQIAGKLEFIVQDVENMSLFLIGQKDIQGYLGDNGQADISRYTLNVGFLTNLAFSKKYISNITITSANGYSELSNSTILHSSLPEVLKRDKEQYESNTRYWSSLYENQTTEGLKRVVSLVRPIRSINNFQYLGRLSISIDEAEIYRYLTDAGWEEKGFVLLLDAEGRVLSGRPEWLNKPIGDLFPELGDMKEGSGVLSGNQGKEPSTVLYYTLPNIGWKLVGFIPTVIYTAQNSYVLTVTAGAMAIALLFTVGLVLYFVQWVTRPLTKLTQTMKDINPDEPLPTYKVRSSDEVGLLLHSFNKLSDRIQRLKLQVQHNEAKKKEADIMALQAQINPHFLYNTLSSIHWIALMNKDRQIAEMVGALSDFLRFSLNKGEEFCPVQQEIAHVRNYAHIMAIRFQDKFDITFYVDPELLPLPMLKLLLQPLIENSLMHGIQKLSGNGHVYVHGERHGQEMKFTVEDTGIGINEEKLREIRRQLQASELGAPMPGKSGYGLRNVHNRLKLHYGSGSGLAIDSEPGSGTRISFTIPIMEAEA